LIRLSAAHAKLRLSSTIEEEDTKIAFNVLHFALFSEIEKEEDFPREKTIK